MFRPFVEMKLQSCKFHVFCECKLAENKIASIDRVRLRVRGLNEINKFSAFSKEISGRTPTTRRVSAGTVPF